MSSGEAGPPLVASGEQIRQREFATVRRGYDPEQVRAYLTALAVHVETLERRARRRESPGVAAPVGATGPRRVRGAVEAVRRGARDRRFPGRAGRRPGARRGRSHQGRGPGPGRGRAHPQLAVADRRPGGVRPHAREPRAAAGGDAAATARHAVAPALGRRRSRGGDPAGTAAAGAGALVVRVTRRARRRPHPRRPHATGPRPSRTSGSARRRRGPTSASRGCSTSPPPTSPTCPICATSTSTSATTATADDGGAAGARAIGRTP